MTYKPVNDNRKMKITDLSSMSREELEKAYVELNSKLDSANAMISWYEEQYKLSKQKLFGRSSETITSGQISLFDIEEFRLMNEAEALREPINIEPSPEELTGVETEQAAAKTKRSRKKKTIKLPVVTTVYELSESECMCGKCGHKLSFMKDVIQTEIEVEPAKVYVRKSVSKQYACRICDRKGESGIITAPGASAKLIPGSMASPSLIADAISKKYVDATPFYRQEQNHKRNNVPITRNNLCNWSIRVANDYFRFITDRMKAILYADGVIHCDETHVEVLQEPDRPATRQSWIWVTTTAECIKEHPMALYNYTESRSQKDARQVLEGYKGYIMCDGYRVYDTLSLTGRHGEEPMDVKPVACLVHVRRKFADALKLVKPEDRAGTGAALAVAKLQNIFETDNKLKDMPVEERQKERQGELKILLDDFFAWVKNEYDISLPKTHYGLALNYALEQKDKVMRVLEDGRLELENNKAERAVKPFVIGRKNWLFSNTPAGADASCILYGIVETAKLNGLIPFEYLKHVMETMRGQKITEALIDELLPWSESIPEHVKIPADD